MPIYRPLEGEILEEAVRVDDVGYKYLWHSYLRMWRNWQTRWI
jgi:hypothetical protein